MNNPAGKAEAGSMVLQVRKIGNSIGIILPKEFAAKNGVREGDKFDVVEQVDNGFKLMPHDPVHAKAMKIARHVMDEYKDTFKALAQ